MRVLVNAVSIREGGSLVFLRQFLCRAADKSDFEWFVVVPSGLSEQLPTAGNIHYESINTGVFSLFYYYEITLPALIEEHEVELLFSTTNYLPFRKLECPTLLLVQNAGHFSDAYLDCLKFYDSRWRTLLLWNLKGRWVRHSIQQCTTLTLQTHALADAVLDVVDIEPDLVRVVPHGPGNVVHIESRRRAHSAERIRLGYVSIFGVQKGFGTLLDVAERLKATGCDFELVLTLNPAHREMKRLLDEIASRGLGDVIHNIGDIDADKVSEIYDEIDIFVFPSLCESFGMSLVEALARGVPVLASDTHSNREVAGTAALYFPPDDVDEIVRQVLVIMADPDKRQGMSDASVQVAAKYDWDRAADQLMETMRQTTAPASVKAALTIKTQQHYDRYPFEFVTKKDEAGQVPVQPPAFMKFVDKYIEAGSLVADIGCGPGRSTMVLRDRELDFVGLDLSSRSLTLARERAPGLYLQANNLSLPVREEVFDVVISDGVLHHTADPFAAFQEDIRVLRQGGVLYLGVYRKGGYYHYLYRYPGAVIRWLERFSSGRLLLHLTLVPIYFLAHLLKSKGRRTWRGAVNLFYDYFITPQAEFYSEADIEQWFSMAGLERMAYFPKVGNVHAFVARKR
jgi:glycosyltransferase involved in cell wall biosynthesis/ubiquinone/menaquinone biosynthesis C-methylase UbiE